MIKVYFESLNHSELKATFENESLYIKCLPILEAEAKAQGMKVTESEESNFLYYVAGGEIIDIINDKQPIQNAINEPFAAFKYEQGDDPYSLLKALQGWERFTEISEDQFNELINL